MHFNGNIKRNNVTFNYVNSNQVGLLENMDAFYSKHVVLYRNYSKLLFKIVGRFYQIVEDG